jgi:hypothetical protein
MGDARMGLALTVEEVFVYYAHPSQSLNRVFADRPFQGVAPEAATFLFVGLDANYSPSIEQSPVFPQVLDYLSDGVAFWRKTGLHHPFLLPEYRYGDGARYHRTFARIGFGAEHADLVSFIELLHVPSFGRSKLAVNDLDGDHLRRINQAIVGGGVRYVFVPDSVAKLMRATSAFPWLPDRAAGDGGALSIWSRTDTATVFCHYHLSVYGHQEKKKREQIAEIGQLVRNHARP